jgi:septal ring factor EnvC (AmiA/AmiB activator)
MNPIFIPIAQTVTSAVIEIILLLLGAAIIGFLTAWYYQKSHFTPIINKLEEEKADLNKTIAALNSDISALKTTIHNLENEARALRKTISEKDKLIEELKKPA